MLSSAAVLMEIPAQAERDSGIGLKLFGFIAELVFTIIPESCSGSSRRSVRNHPGIAFTFPRIPHIRTSQMREGQATQPSEWRAGARRKSRQRLLGVWPSCSCAKPSFPGWARIPS